MVLLIDIKVRVLGAKFTLISSDRASSHPAWVALSQLVRVSPPHSDHLNLALHELGEWYDVELGIAPLHHVEAGRDMFKHFYLPVRLAHIPISQHHLVVNDELEHAINIILISNSVLAVLEADRPRGVKVYGVVQVEIHRDSRIGRVISLQ